MWPFVGSGADPLPNILEMPILSIERPFRCRLLDEAEPVEPALLPFCE